MFDFLYLGIALSYIFLTGFVMKHRLSSTAHWMFVVFLLSLLLWHVTLYLYLFIPLGDWLLLIGRFNYAMGPLFTFGLLAFFYSFPKETFRVNKQVKIAFWAWTIFLATISLLTPLIDKNETYVEGIGPVLELGDWYLIYLFHMFAMPLLTLGVGLKKIFKLKGLAKTKFAIAFWIFVPTMLAFVVTNGILPLYGVIWQFVYSPVFLVPIAISSAYAMVRFRFFDLPIQTLRGLRMGILFTGYLLTLSSLHIVLEESLFIGHPFVNIILPAFVALLVWRLIDHYLPEFTSHSFRDFKHQLQIFTSQLFITNQYEEFMHNIESTFVNQLLIQHADVYLVRNNKIDIDLPIYKKDAFIQSIEKEQPAVIVAEESKLQDQELWKKGLKTLDADLCFPLYLDQQVIGLFILGKKTNKNPYSAEEIDEILKAKQFLEMNFLNLLLQSNMKEENDLIKKSIQEKTQKLRQQNKEMRKILQQQSDFIAVTAHEFRTPLNIALFQLSETLGSYNEQSNVLEEMKSMETSLEKLKLLTQNLFDIQKYDLDKVHLEPQETLFHDFLQETTDELKEVLKEKELQLTCHVNLSKDLQIPIDPTKIRQLLHNLIINASHVSKEGDEIKVIAEEQKHSIQISIVDHGPGIPDTMKKEIFNKFRTTKATKGLGLGLYLCKKIIDLHQGSIEVKDTPGGGATFIITLFKHPSLEEKAPRKAPQLSEKTVLSTKK